MRTASAAAGATRELPEVVTTLPDMSIEERRAADLAFLETLRCTPEMIRRTASGNRRYLGGRIAP